MKQITFSRILRGMALSALTNMAMPVAEAWAADEIQVIRPSARTENARMMPFTTFRQETQAITQALPCKWISQQGRMGPSYGGARYDFLCKGGDFATVSLYLDKVGAAKDGVGRVTLLYRDWPANVNPNAGEAAIAQKFLQHVAWRFVPASMADEMVDAFWTDKNARWTAGGVKAQFSFDQIKGQNFRIRKLVIEGTHAALSPQIVKTTQAQTPPDMGLAKVTDAPQRPTQMFVYGVDGEPLKAAERVLPGVAITSGMPERAALDSGLTKEMPVPQPPVETPTNVKILSNPDVSIHLDPVMVLPKPSPLPVAPEQPVQVLVVPQNAPAGTEGGDGHLEKANPAELNTAPAPESKVVPVAPPEPSATLVPGTQDLLSGRQRAPSNFDAYNRAVELTKSVEERAQIAKVEQAKITASKPDKKVSQTVVVTPTAVVPALQPVQPAGEGLGVKVPAIEEVGQPLNYNGPRSSDVRPLPQLKFVPKAEPLRATDEVIQFEDEKSKL